MSSPRLANGSGWLGAERASCLATRRLLELISLFPALALLSGCATSFAPASPLQIDTGTQTLHSSQPLTLSASLAGEPATTEWRILSTNNASALGRGTLSASGKYVAPAILSRDQVTVILGAASGSQTAETSLTITPAFAEPLQPENAALPAGATLEIRAQLAEVTGGTVRWQLATGLSVGGLAADLGTLSGQHCTRAYNQFTTCTVLYTAPATLPSDPHVQVIATAPGLRTPARAVTRLLLGTIFSNPVSHQQEQRAPIALGSSGSNDNDFDTFADRAGAHFVSDCCGGTLGAVVEDQNGTPYLLSNNHVLALSDQGRPSDPIEHPGLIDDACVPLTRPGAQLRAIGSLSYAVPLHSGGGGPRTATCNVDAALASLLPGGVDAGGAILEVGPEADPTSSPVTGPAAGLEAATETASAASGQNTLRPAPPTAGTGEQLDASTLAGLRVVKSGRTTGLTCSSVEAVDLRIRLDYYRDCAETAPYTTRTYTGQIAIGGDAFADAGDSGALLLDAANAQPVGLLYATATSGDPGALPMQAEEAASSSRQPDSHAASIDPAAGSGTGLTLANPIGDVLSELGEQIGPETRLSVRGSVTPHRLACLNYDTRAPRAAFSTLTPDERTRTSAAMEAASTLRANPSVQALAPGVSEDSPGEGAILISTNPPSSDRNSAALVAPSGTSARPAVIAGVRTVFFPAERKSGSTPAASVFGQSDAQDGLHLTAAQWTLVRATVERLAPGLMSTGAIFGVGAAQSLDDPSAPAVLVLVDADASRLAVAQVLRRVSSSLASDGGGDVSTKAEQDLDSRLPATLDGLRVRYLRLHRFRVTRSKYLAQGAPTSCPAKRLETPPL